MATLHCFITTATENCPLSLRGLLMPHAHMSVHAHSHRGKDGAKMAGTYTIGHAHSHTHSYLQRKRIDHWTHTHTDMKPQTKERCSDSTMNINLLYNCLAVLNLELLLQYVRHSAYCRTRTAGLNLTALSALHCPARASTNDTHCMHR